MDDSSLIKYSLGDISTRVNVGWMAILNSLAKQYNKIHKSKKMCSMFAFTSQEQLRNALSHFQGTSQNEVEIYVIRSCEWHTYQTFQLAQSRTHPHGDTLLHLAA